MSALYLKKSLLEGTLSITMIRIAIGVVGHPRVEKHMDALAVLLGWLILLAQLMTLPV